MPAQNAPYRRPKRKPIEKKQRTQAREKKRDFGEQMALSLIPIAAQNLLRLGTGSLTDYISSERRKEAATLADTRKEAAAEAAWNRQQAAVVGSPQWRKRWEEVDAPEIAEETERVAEENKRIAAQRKEQRRAHEGRKAEYEAKRAVYDEERKTVPPREYARGAGPGRLARGRIAGETFEGIPGVEDVEYTPPAPEAPTAPEALPDVEMDPRFGTATTPSQLRGATRIRRDEEKRRLAGLKTDIEMPRAEELAAAGVDAAQADPIGKEYTRFFQDLVPGTGGKWKSVGSLRKSRAELEKRIKYWETTGAGKGEGISEYRRLKSLLGDYDGMISNLTSNQGGSGFKFVVTADGKIRTVREWNKFTRTKEYRLITQKGMGLDKEGYETEMGPLLRVRRFKTLEAAQAYQTGVKVPGRAVSATGARTAEDRANEADAADINLPRQRSNELLDAYEAAEGKVDETRKRLDTLLNNVYGTVREGRAGGLVTAGQQPVSVDQYKQEITDIIGFLPPAENIVFQEGKVELSRLGGGKKQISENSRLGKAIAAQNVAREAATDPDTKLLITRQPLVTGSRVAAQRRARRSAEMWKNIESDPAAAAQNIVNGPGTPEQKTKRLNTIMSNFKNKTGRPLSGPELQAFQSAHENISAPSE